MTLAAAIGQWRLIEADFQQTYGIDLDEPRYRAKSWRWFRVRLDGLLSDTSTRLWRHFAPTPDDEAPAPDPDDEE